MIDMKDTTLNQTEPLNSELFEIPLDFLWTSSNFPVSHISRVVQLKAGFHAWSKLICLSHHSQDKLSPSLGVWALMLPLTSIYHKLMHILSQVYTNWMWEISLLPMTLLSTFNLISTLNKINCPKEIFLCHEWELITRRLDCETTIRNCFLWQLNPFLWERENVVST